MKLEWIIMGPDTRTTTDGEFKAEATRYSKMTTWRLFRKVDGAWQPVEVNHRKFYQLHAAKYEAQRLKDES